MLRRLLRPILGRERPIWRVLRAPRLRFALFGDPVDCLIYALLISRTNVRFIQVGSNDGRTGDPLWTFRYYRNWSGVMVEPVAYVFRKLARNYARWPDRFVLVNKAVARTSETRAFHYVAETDASPDTVQLGSFDGALIRSHLERQQRASHVVTENVPCLDFATLCETHGVGSLDLLHIDAEGADGEILEQVDLSRLQPAIVLFEHVHLTVDLRAALWNRLSAAGYEALALPADTLAVHRAAMQAHPRLRSAWRRVSGSG